MDFERPLPEGLFEHQIEGAHWLDARGSGILADEQGLGKTATAISIMDLPAVIVCPSSLKLNWLREIRRWRPELTVEVIDSTARQHNYRAHVVIVNYEKCKGITLQKLIARRNVTLVLDEAHLLKDLRVFSKFEAESARVIHYASGAKRAQRIWGLARNCDRRILLTGTPMINGRHCELFSLLHLVDPSAWRTFLEYSAEFCPGEEKWIGRPVIDYNTNTNPQKLRQLTSERYILRRTKKELKDLPEKFRSSVIVELPIEFMHEYRKAEVEFGEWLEENGGIANAFKNAKNSVTAKLVALRQIAAEGKAPIVANDAVQHVIGSDKPLVIMGHHKKALKGIAKFLDNYNKNSFGRKIKYSYIVGDNSIEERDATVTAFQAGKIDILLCSISCAGVGLTLTTADTMYFVERMWRPFDNLQAEDRIHRIGQKSTCYITYYEAVGTVDRHVATTTQEKFEAAGIVLDGVELSEKDSLGVVYGDITKLFDFSADGF